MSLTYSSVNSEIVALLLNLDAIANDFFTPSIKDFLVDYSVNFLFDLLMYLCISFIALGLLRYFSSALIPINSQPSYFSTAFCLFISWSIFLSL